MVDFIKLVKEGPIHQYLLDLLNAIKGVLLQHLVLYMVCDGLLVVPHSRQ